MEEATVGQEDWTYVATLCLDDESEVTEGVTEVEVRRAFTELTWPEATLLIQPPDGETLVNLPTIFRTPDTAAQSRSVTLLGVRIQLEATPTSWTWHWAQPGDDATEEDVTTHTTTTPGAAHPNATITHAYRRASDAVRPSVDVTYTGRYRVGGGAWIDIDGTHVVAGTPQSLRVLEARPTRIR
ncbi:hypothetical protein [Nocardioides gilvus]|uniref:hypothetical protein n=1 Tax=Nocardioides gilvus TaxID=1735589 RepID=UPI000D74B0D7|nr:hypothetical protein [Nocardioides gilvus]